MNVLIEVLVWLASLLSFPAIPQVQIVPLPGSLPGSLPVAYPATERVGVPIFYGLSFDGGDYVSATNAATGGDFDFGTTSFSMALWVYPTAVTDYRMLWVKTHYLTLSSGNVNVYLVSGANTIDLAGAGMVVNQWQHVAFVVDRVGQTLKLYRNGAQVGNTGNVSAIGTLTNSVTAVLGRFGGDDLYYLSGKICNFRVWKGTALTAAQLTTEAANTNPYRFPTVNPTLFMPFTESAGTTLSPRTYGTCVFTLPAAPSTPTWTVKGAVLPPTTF